MPTTKIKCPDCKTSRVITINKGRTVKCLKCDQHYYLELEAKTGFTSNKSKAFEKKTTVIPGPADIKPCVCSRIAIEMHENFKMGLYLFACACGVASSPAASIGEALQNWNK